MLAQRVKRYGPLHHLADAAVGPAAALGRECRDELGISLIALGGVEERTKESLGRPFGAGRVQRHAQRIEDFGQVALETLPRLVADFPWSAALPRAAVLGLRLQGDNQGWNRARGRRL